MTFLRNDRIRHKKSCKDYMVLLTPQHGLRIEATNEPAYAYQAMWSGRDPIVWVRSQEQMEDGRFEIVMHSLAGAEGRLP
jgi:hypothetical protein